MEFQAVIMAAGKGSRIMEVTSNTPKCLLPVCNIPVISSCLQLLKSAKVSNIIIMVKEVEKNEIVQAIENQLNSKIEIIGIPKNEDWGTADSLRYIKDKIVRDVIVVSCDLVTNFDLRKMISMHRRHNSSLTILLSPWPETIKSAVIPGRKGKYKQEKDIIGMDEDGRLIFFNSEADLEGGVNLKMSILTKHPEIQFRSDLMDSHVYMMKKQVADFVISNTKISTLKGEFLPIIIAKQFSKKQNVLGSKTQDKANADSYLSDQAMPMSLEDNPARALCETRDKDELKCYACIDEEAFCMRANTLVAYAEINRQTPKILESVMAIEKMPSVYPKSQVDADSVIGQDCEFGEKVSIKHSVVGHHCRFGEKVKISNSILMNRVVISPNASIHNCIISNNVQVGMHSELKNCVIGNDQKVKDSSKLVNELLQASDQFMEV